MQTGQSPSVIYIVDDDADIRDSLAMLVQSAGFRTEVFASGEDILARAEALADGCLLLDVCLPGRDGVQVLRALRDRGIALPTVLMSGHPGVVADVRQVIPDEIPVLQKPMSDTALFSAIRAALRWVADGRGNHGGRGGGSGGGQHASESAGVRSDGGGGRSGGGRTWAALRSIHYAMMRIPHRPCPAI